MAKIELKGKIITVSEIALVGEKGLKKQTVVFNVPPYVDEYGDAKGNDELWELSILGDNVAKLNFQSFTHELTQGKVGVYINSNVARNKENKEIYIINAVVHSWEPKPVKGGSNA